MNQEELACPLTKGERILIALDGSKYGDAALDQAISLGRTCNSTIYAICVIELYPEQMEAAPALTEKLSGEAWETLDKAKAKVESASGRSSQYLDFELPVCSGHGLTVEGGGESEGLFFPSWQQSLKPPSRQIVAQ